MNYHFTCIEENGGYWGECREIAGCATQGGTREEFIRNCGEALNLMLDEPEDSAVCFPLPDASLDGAPGLVAVPVEPEIAFAVVLRDYRSHHSLTQRQAADMLGMRNVYSYQRLERRSNATLSLMKRIYTAFPGIQLRQVLPQ